MVRRVSVDPLILVTVPVSPPQNPPPKKPPPNAEGPPNPAPANGAPQLNPNPPRAPKDGLWRVEGEGLGLVVAAVVLAFAGDAARVTTNPAAAPTTAIVRAIPTMRTRPTRLVSGATGGGEGGVSG